MPEDWKIENVFRSSQCEIVGLCSVQEDMNLKDIGARTKLTILLKCDDK
jgi:hypothetical protein